MVGGEINQNIEHGPEGGHQQVPQLNQINHHVQPPVKKILQVQKLHIFL